MYKIRSQEITRQIYALVLNSNKEDAPLEVVFFSTHEQNVTNKFATPLNLKYNIYL